MTDQALRQYKLMRFATEAYDQGGLLVQEDLALLPNSGRRTIQRDIAYLKKQDVIIPTRGINSGHRPYLIKQRSWNSISKAMNTQRLSEGQDTQGNQ
jgi:DeoR/GlpR family transcriptional regulator of sugar metabolism